MRIYFDTCCYNRPFDDLSQERIRQESDAILAIVARNYLNNGTIIGSAALLLEIAAITNKNRKGKVIEMYKIVSDHIKRNDEITERALQLQQVGMHAMDSMHIALAESADAIFLTVDDKL